MKFVAVVSCVAGIAYTYTAAEALETTGRQLGHEVVVETQGAALPAGGTPFLDRFYAGLQPVDPAVIAAADCVIVATAREVRGRERFAGKTVVDVGVKEAAENAKGVIEQAVAAVEANAVG